MECDWGAENANWIQCRFTTAYFKNRSFYFLSCYSGYVEKHFRLSTIAGNSNIGVPGIYAFRIDQENITDPSGGIIIVNNWFLYRFILWEAKKSSCRCCRSVSISVSQKPGDTLQWNFAQRFESTVVQEHFKFVCKQCCLHVNSKKQQK